MYVYELIELRKKLDDVSNYNGIDFAYAVFKNKQIIDQKLMEINFVRHISPKVIEYEKNRVLICEEFSKKDDNGNPLKKDNLFIIDDKEAFKIKMDELFDKYKSYIEERQNQINLFDKKMNEEIDLPFLKIKKEQIPTELKTSKDLEKIYFMLE